MRAWYAIESNLNIFLLLSKVSVLLANRRGKFWKIYSYYKSLHSNIEYDTIIYSYPVIINILNIIFSGGHDSIAPGLWHDGANYGIGLLLWDWHCY